MKNPFITLRNVGSLPQLPESFLFGVANADHQVEAYDPKREDIRDVWERERKLTPRGRATDFEHRYAEDIDLARKMGCTAFRFSIAWSRVEPAPGIFDEEAFNHYRRLIQALRSAGLEPIVTLHHYTWPVHVEQRGGLIADDFPAIFGRYVTEVAGRLGQDVRIWCTFNEPNQLPFGYIKPWWQANYAMPPGLPEGAGGEEQVQAVGKLMRNLFLAHTEARRIIREQRPDALVSTNALLLGLPVWLQRFVNWNAGRMRTYDDFARQEGRLAERSLLEHGRADVTIAMLSRTPEREGQVMFSETYFLASLALLVPAASTAAGVRDLSRQPIVAVRGSTAEARAAELLPSAQLLPVGDYEAALASLDASQAAALLADDTILRGLMARHPGRYRLLAKMRGTEAYAAAVPQGHGDLLDVLDQVIRDFKASGAWAEAYARFLGEPVPEPPASPARSVAFTRGTRAAHSAVLHHALDEEGLPLAKPGSALRRIQDRGYLVVALRGDMPGFSYRDESTGDYSGLEIEIARAVARRIFGGSGNIHYLQAGTRERIPALRSLLRFLDPLLKNFSILSATLASTWWHLGMAGKLPEFLCPAECVGQQDYVGLDYYWGVRALRLDRIQALIDSALGRYDRAPVWPGALYGYLRYLSGLFPGMPMLILENGCVDVADGVDRVSFIRRHVHQVQRAARDGVNLMGYICWSITSNREWGLPFDKASDFGLYHVELDNDPELRRMPTAAVPAYSQIIAGRGVPADAAAQAAVAGGPATWAASRGPAAGDPAERISIYENATIITMNPRREIIRRGAIVVKGQKIAAVGNAEDVAAQYPGQKRVNCNGNTILPGLIDMHVHTAQAMIRGSADDLALLDWLARRVWVLQGSYTRDDARASAALCALEMIKSGTTSFLECMLAEIYGFDGVAETIVKSGLRAALAKIVMDLPSYASAKNIMPIGMVEDGETGIQNTLAAYERWQGAGDGRIQVWFGPRSPGAVVPETYERVAELAAERGMGITVHLAEVREDLAYAAQQGCRSPIEFAQRYGLLGPRSVLAHCVWTDEKDWELMARTGSHVAHNPASNAKTATGIAPVRRMLAAGVNVALGCDGGPSNNTYDMIRDMRLASYLANLLEQDPTAVPAETVLEMATINGAKALGIAGQAGSLEIGKRADFIIVDMTRAHVTPAPDPVSTLVYAAHGSDVDTVVVDGQVLMQGRRVMTLDEGAIVAEARERFARVAERAGLELGPRWPVI